MDQYHHSQEHLGAPPPAPPPPAPAPPPPARTPDHPALAQQYPPPGAHGPPGYFPDYYPPQPPHPGPPGPEERPGKQRRGSKRNSQPYPPEGYPPPHPHDQYHGGPPHDPYQQQVAAYAPHPGYDHYGGHHPQYTPHPHDPYYNGHPGDFNEFPLDPNGQPWDAPEEAVDLGDKRRKKKSSKKKDRIPEGPLEGEYVPADLDHPRASPPAPEAPISGRKSKKSKKTKKARSPSPHAALPSAPSAPATPPPEPYLRGLIEGPTHSPPPSEKMKDPKWELDRLEFAPRSSAHKHVQKFERLVNKIWEGQEMDPKYKWDLFASTLERSKGWSNGRGITPGKWIHVIEERAPMSYEQVKIAFLETWGKNDRSKLGHNRESSHESAGDFALVQVTPPNAPYSDQSDSERERSGRGQSLDIQAEEGKIVLSFNQNGKRSSKNPSKITLEFKPEKALPAPKQVEAPPPPPPPPAALPAAPLPPSHPYSDSESEPESMLMEENKQYQRDQPPAPAPPPHMTPPAPYPPTPAAGAAPEAPQAPMAPPPPSHTPQPPPQGHPHYQYYQQPYQTPQGEHPPPLQSNPQTPYQQPPPPPQPQQQQQQPGPDQHPQDRPQYQQHNSYHFPPDRGYTPGPPPDRGYTPGPPPDRGYTPAPELRTPYYDHPAPPKSDRPSYEMDIRKLAPSPGPLLARTPSPVTLPDSTAPPTRPRLLENKVIAITGAGRGIGRALALGFAREGAHIIAHYFNSPTSPNQDDIVALCVEIRSLGQGCTIVFGDISDPKTSETIVRKAVEQYGHLDVAVSNAGVCEYAEMEDVTPDQWLRHVDVNLSGGYFFVQAAAAQMKKQFLAAQAEAAEDGANREPDDASIICISSSGGVSPGRQTHFLPTSAGLQALMRSSAVALGKFGIRCNSILVGVVRTKMVREELKEGGREKVEEGVPLGRLGRAEDVVGPACMLAGEMGRWVTGAEIRVDGGMGVFSG